MLEPNQLNKSLYPLFIPLARNLHIRQQQPYSVQTALQPVHVYHSVTQSPDIHANSSTEIFPEVSHGNMAVLSRNIKASFNKDKTNKVWYSLEMWA